MKNALEPRAAALLEPSYSSGGGLVRERVVGMTKEDALGFLDEFNEAFLGTHMCVLSRPNFESGRQPRGIHDEVPIRHRHERVTPRWPPSHGKTPTILPPRRIEG